MSKFILLNISLKEPVKTDLSYIQGSTIRGAYISKYINKNNIKEDIALNEEYRKKLLSNSIRFSNAYPLVDNRYSIPTPLCFYSTKEDLKKFGKENSSVNVVNEFEEEIKEGYQRVNKKEFSIINNKVLELVSTSKIENLHTRKVKKIDTKNNEDDKNDSGDLFRYTAIDKGYKLYSIIQCEENNVDEIINVIDKEIVYLGGSKGSGYGRCDIKVDKVLDYSQLKDIKQIPYNSKAKSLSIYFLSDSIIRDEYGQVTSHISPEYLQEKLNIYNVKYVKGSVLTTQTKGYNTTLKTNLPSLTAIKAGTILTYSYDGELNIAQINKFEIDGVGCRKEQGYGNIIINPKFEVESCEFYKEDIQKEEINTDLKQESKNILGMVLNNINQERTKDALTKIAIEALDTYSDSKNIKKVVLNLTKSQIGRLVDIIDRCQDEKDDEKAKQILLDFRRSLKTKTKNEYSNKSKNRLFNYPLYIDDSKKNNNIDYFDALVSDIDINTLTGSSIDLNNISMNGVGLQNRNNFRLKLNITKELLMYKLRKEGGKKDEK